MIMDAETIAKKARASIGQYCMDECRAYCCRKGYLVLTLEQAKIITHDRVEEFLKTDALKRLENGRYSLNLGATPEGCPSLKDYKCMIHKNKKRPQACKDFPVFLEGKSLKLSPR
jgi:Fe-S-cluster containining protein